MCEQIVQFCSGSAKPLVFAGGFTTLLLAIALSYSSYATQSLYTDIDASVAQAHSVSYHLQLAAAIYLLLLTIFSFVTAHYDHKHSIRALAIISAVNFILATTAILMLPSSTELDSKFSSRLKEAQELYDFHERFNKTVQVEAQAQSEGQIRKTRMIAGSATTAAIQEASQTVQGNSSINKITSEPLTGKLATQIWDKLQSRGCCGLKNHTEWTSLKTGVLPKSCCISPKLDESINLTKCSEVDANHNEPCADIIAANGSHLMIVLALIALANLYLATVSGISAYRTFHYNEASQNAYS